MPEQVEQIVNQARAYQLLSNKYSWYFIVKGTDFVGQLLKEVYA